MRTVSCIGEEENYDYTKFSRRNCFLCRARWQESVCLFSRLVRGLSLPQAFLPEIEAENPEFTFILIDRDAYMDLAKVWDVYGIPSLVVLERIRKSVGLSIGIENQGAAYSILSRIKIGEKHDCNIQQRTSRRCLDADLENSGEAKLGGGERKEKWLAFTVRTSKKPLPGIFLMPHLSSPSKARAKSF